MLFIKSIVNMNSDSDTSEEGYEGKIMFELWPLFPDSKWTPQLVPGHFVFKTEYKFFIKHFALVTCMQTHGSVLF